MAQHDYDIANQSFPSFRTDLNNVLAAIRSTNSGSSAPSTPFANQLWYDSSANILYIRNEDNDANIALFSLDQSNDVSALLATLIDVQDASGTNTAGTNLTIRAGAGTGTGAGGNIILQTANAGSSGSSVNSHATAVTVDDAGNVGVGATPVKLLHVHEASTSDAEIHMTNTSSGATASDGLTIFANEGSAGLLYRENSPFRFFTNGAEAGRFLADGTFLVGKTALDFDGGVFEAGSGGTFVSRAGMPFGVNRNSSDGELTNFYKDGSQVGSISNNSTNLKVNGVGALEFSENGTTRVFVDAGGFFPFLDNTYDIGSSSLRFDDIFATNTSIIGTSDQNEKQQIASLTDTEITAAKAISKLFKTFKWNDSVAAKGENARTHTGHIAQEVKSAMTDAGLDASKYAFFCSDTWWEKEIQVPAVEAADAVTETRQDEEGKDFEVVVKEAIEAQDAYTRIDYYDKADEAPEGATEKTRLGIRYPELLAFIGAATEQRLTSIEARLTALEG